MVVAVVVIQAVAHVQLRRCELLVGVLWLSRWFDCAAASDQISVQVARLSWGVDKVVRNGAPSRSLSFKLG